MGLSAAFLSGWTLPTFAATTTYLSNNVYTVPASGVTMLQIVAKGGGGGGGSTASAGGTGAKVITYQPVTANQQLTITIGTGGQSASGGSTGGNGEGNGGLGVANAGGGGGSTSVIDGTTVQIIAGGGGGGSSGPDAVAGGNGGTISTPTQPASCTTPLAPLADMCYPGAAGLAVTDTAGAGASGSYTAGPPSINAGGGNGSNWRSDGTTGSNGNGGDGNGSGGGGGAGAGGGGGGIGGGGTAAGGAGGSRVSTNSLGPTYSGGGGTGGAVNTAGGDGSVVITSLTADTFTWSATPTMTFGGATATWTATSGNALAVTETSRTPTVCTISGTTITAVAGGTCAIRAATGSYVTGNPSGIGGWEDQSFTISQASQTISFGALSNKTIGDSAFAVSATSDSGLTVAFSSTTTGICTVAGTTATIVAAGTCTIRASQAGDASYSAASNVDQSFTVAATVPGAPTIGAATAGDTQASVAFSAPVSNGGATITGYTVTSSPGGLTGTGASSPIVVTGLTNGATYTFTVTATNSVGTGSASAASNSVIPVASQTITFSNPGQQSFGTTPTLTATATSGLTVAFTSSTTNVCTITSGGAMTFVTTGTCTISADQAGNASFTAASTVSRSFTVNAVAPGAPIIGTVTAGDTQASVAFSAPASTGGANITGYTVTSSPGGLTGTGSSSPIAVTGLTNGTTYTFTVTATNSAGTGSASAASNSVVPAASQTITFSNPGAQNFGTTPTLTATATSGLIVAFTSSTTNVCTITSGGAMTFVATGTCTISADQAGNASFTAASTVSRSFTVNAVVPGVPTIGTATAGNAQASVTFVAPGFNGGASITGYTVTASPGGLTAIGAASPLTVAGLTSGTAYTFTVVARNSIGSGAASLASNSVTLFGDLVVTAPADIDVDAVGLFTPVDIGTATVSDNNIAPTVIEVNGAAVTAKPTHFRPGVNTVMWAATDSSAHTVTASQIVNVTPLVSFSKSQVGAEGSTASFKVILNGSAVTYPVTVPYAVGGTASPDGSDHDLVAGSVVINSPNLEATVNVHLVNDGAGEGTERVVITMGVPTNAVVGSVATHTIEIHEGNVAPTVALSADQGGGSTRIIGQINGMVTVTAVVTDPNVGDVHTFIWDGTDNALVDADALANTFTFDPSGLAPGVYALEVAVGDGAASGQAQLVVKVESALASLTAADSDGDGVGDNVEGTGDSDGDGIPNYLDSSAAARNVLQGKQATDKEFLVETEPGLVISLGQIAFQAGDHNARVTDSDVQAFANNGAGAVSDEGQSFNGGLFDFNVAELPVVGQQVKIVLAQFAAIPARAVYRKLMASGWQDFVVDAHNSVASAAGAAGYCPPPGDSAYTAGLVQGDWCVQLTIEDGGPNDADGVADGKIKDPGGVGVRFAEPITVTITGSGGGGVVAHWLLLLALMSIGVLRRRRGGSGHRLLMLPITLLGANVQADDTRRPDFGATVIATQVDPTLPDGVAISGSAGHGIAADAWRYYAGVSYLAAKNEQRSSEFEMDVRSLGLTASVTQNDLTRSGWSSYFGYRVHELVAVELSYIDLGAVATTISGETADVNSYLDAAAVVRPATAAGWTFDLALRLPVTDRVNTLTKIGAFRWSSDYTLASATASKTFSDNGTDVNLGVGLEIEIEPRLPVRVVWNHYRFAGTNVSALEIGLGYRFRLGG